MQNQTRENDYDDDGDDDDHDDDDARLHYDVTLLLPKLFSFPSVKLIFELQKITLELLDLLFCKQKPITSQCKRLHDQRGKVQTEETAYSNNFKELY